MANFSYKITMPKNGTENDLTELRMKLDYGIITHVQIIIPDGQKEVAHVRIKYHEFQVYPLNKGEWYAGDGSNIEFDDMFPIIVEPYELKAEGYNTSTKYDHSIIMILTVQRPEELGYEKIPQFVIRKLYELIGKEFEI